ncbi:MAG: two-component system OmpR family sensor kinase, partial [Kiritimatiellia bacterium]
AQADSPQVSVRAAIIDGVVVLRVQDRGPGVDRKVQKRMFQPFVRGERELTRRTRGTGIGLALVRARVEGMGGTVTAANHAEGGLEVVVRLPTRLPS